MNVVGEEPGDGEAVPSQPWAQTIYPDCSGGMGGRLTLPGGSTQRWRPGRANCTMGSPAASGTTARRRPTAPSQGCGFATRASATACSTGGCDTSARDPWRLTGGWPSSCSCACTIWSWNRRRLAASGPIARRTGPRISGRRAWLRSSRRRARKDCARCRTSAGGSQAE